jgi:hypothetical protein
MATWARAAASFKGVRSAPSRAFTSALDASSVRACSRLPASTARCSCVDARTPPFPAAGRVVPAGPAGVACVASASGRARGARRRGEVGEWNANHAVAVAAAHGRAANAAATSHQAMRGTGGRIHRRVAARDGSPVTGAVEDAAGTAPAGAASWGLVDMVGGRRIHPSRHRAAGEAKITADGRSGPARRATGCNRSDRRRRASQAGRGRDFCKALQARPLCPGTPRPMFT